MAGVRCAIRRNSLRVAREDGLERRVAGFWCAIVLEVGIEAPGFILCGDLAYGIPRKQGLGLRHSLLRRDLASLHSAFPTPLPRGPWHNNRKKLKRAPARPSWFLYTVIPYASKLATVCQCTKKALKRCLRAFFCCCAVRGGFEPPVRLPVRQFSKLVVSATHPSHLSAQWVICLHKRFGTAKIC